MINYSNITRVTFTIILNLKLGYTANSRRYNASSTIK